MRGVILYGPPAAGKDTVTCALHELDPSYVLFRRLKAGPGRTGGYRITTPEHIKELRDRGDIVWENHRYHATYVIDRPSLVERLHDHVPILHLGQLEAIDAVIRATPAARWLAVYLWCPRDIAAVRIAARRTRDDTDRLHAWDQTTPLPDAHLTINTATTPPAEAAQLVHHAVRADARCSIPGGGTPRRTRAT